MPETGVCATCGAENVEVDPTTEQCADCAAALEEGGAPLGGAEPVDMGLDDEDEM